MTSDHPYQMTISLNVLKHLGIGLYSNIPAVLTEAVANAWDADASNVRIDIDLTSGTITIEDDGSGMSVSDVNKKYLTVGYATREENGGKTLHLGRPVMGRKGVGKLSLFSIANTVTIYSVAEGGLHGFEMDVERIEENIRKGKSTYYPDPVPVDGIRLEKGTRIVLSHMQRDITRSKALKKRLARRFSIIGEEYGFVVTLNGEKITIQDQKYYEKLQYIWTFGEGGEAAASNAPRAKKFSLSPEVEINGVTERVDGWIGTVKEAGQAKDTDEESINRIVVMARGRMAQEDVLEGFGEGGLYSKYVVGQIHADFLDSDNKADMSTTGRQRLIEDDLRYQGLKSKIKGVLGDIQKKWTDLRNEDGEKVALQIPQIDEWYKDLNHDQRSAAKRLFGKINQLAVQDDDVKRRLFISGILAFESLKLRNMLERLNDISLDHLEVLDDVFAQHEDLEASAYYQITKQRLEVISAFDNIAGNNEVLERVVQRYLFDHLWLIDPSWNKVEGTAVIETKVKNAFGDVDTELSDDEKGARLDLKYTTTGNRHVIVELKRPRANIEFFNLLQQISKYSRAARKVLKAAGKEHDLVETVCVVGKFPSNWADSAEEQRDRQTLKQYNARIVQYSELVASAQEAYKAYTEKQEKVARIYELIRTISTADAAAIG